MSEQIWIDTYGLHPRFAQMGLWNVKSFLRMLCEADESGRVWSRYEMKNIMCGDYMTVASLPECREVMWQRESEESGLPYIQINPKYVMYRDPNKYHPCSALAPTYDEVSKEFLMDIVAAKADDSLGLLFDRAARTAKLSRQLIEFSRQLERKRFRDGDAFERYVWIKADEFTKLAP